MWDGCDSQEVGLEAAILERVRNSSLVELFCADNVAGLQAHHRSHANRALVGVWLGRGASRTPVKHDGDVVWRVWE